jgi:NitT/TauT family transport system ATP-binding protein
MADSSTSNNQRDEARKVISVAPALPVSDLRCSDKLIKISGLEKRYFARQGGAVNALEGVTLDIAKGELISIVGPSGCGKSSLMRLIAGLEAPTSGSVTVGGTPVKGTRNDIGIVFQQATLLPWQTVLDNVLLPARAQRIDCRERALHLLELVGLRDFANRYPFELSGGMQQRAAICRALVCNPKVLLMDEPFGALDAMTREQMNVELLRIQSEERNTIVFITHSIPEAVFLGDRVVVMTPRPGRIERIIDIDLPKPRNMATMGAARFGVLTSEIRMLLTGNSSEFHL